MKYYENDFDGYIVSVSVDRGSAEIPVTRYNEILSMLTQKPAPTDTTDYRLKTDLTWEAYAIPAPEPHSPTAEDKAEAFDILTGVSE